MLKHELRLGAIDNLKRGLNRGMLTFHSYEALYNRPDGTLISLTFKDNPEFQFALQHPRSDVNSSTSWKTVESPSRHFVSTEVYEHRDFDQAFNAVYSWADRVGEELVLRAKTQSDTSIIDQWREQLERTLDDLPQPDEPFTPDELEDWAEKFKLVLARLAEIESHNEVQRSRIDQLSRELDQLKSHSPSAPKRTWLRTAGNKLFDLLDTGSKATIKALAEGAVKALLEQKL